MQFTSITVKTKKKPSNWNEKRFSLSKVKKNTICSILLLSYQLKRFHFDLWRNIFNTFPFTIAAFRKKMYLPSDIQKNTVDLLRAIILLAIWLLQCQWVNNRHHYVSQASTIRISLSIRTKDKISELKFSL